MNNISQPQEIFAHLIVKLHETNPVSSLRSKTFDWKGNDYTEERRREKIEKEKEQYLLETKNILKKYPQVTNFCLNLEGNCLTFFEFFALGHPFFSDLKEQMLKVIDFYPAKNIFFDMQDKKWVKVNYYQEDILARILSLSARKDNKEWIDMLLNAIEEKIDNKNLDNFFNTIEYLKRKEIEVVAYRKTMALVNSQFSQMFNDGKIKMLINKCEAIYQKKALEVKISSTEQLVKPVKIL